MVEKILQKALDGLRISSEEALHLFAMKDTLLLGNVAQRLARRKSQEQVVTYIVDRNINHTNICTIHKSYELNAYLQRRMLYRVIRYQRNFILSH